MTNGCSALEFGLDSKMTLSRRLFLAGAAISPAAAQKLAPGDPNSPERLTLIETFEGKIKDLAARFEARTHRPVDGWSMPYRLFRPTNTNGKLPLVLYLHGSGGTGVDNQKQLTGGNRFGALLWTLPEVQDLQRCYVAAPQTDRGWIRYATPRTLATKRSQMPDKVPGLGPGAAAVVDLVKTLTAELSLDDRRIYLCGNSMGGGGCWHLLAHHGELFAAAVPFCGGASPESGAENPRIPVWNFHGDADESVNVQISRDRISARRKAGGKPLHSEYRGVGHNVSQWAATEPALPAWLFQQHR